MFERKILQRVSDVNARISGVALGWNTPEFQNHRLEILGAGVLAGSSSGFAGNIFFHQRAAEIVGSGVQAELRKPAVQLHPRDLNVVDRTCEQNAGQSMHLQVLRKRGTGAGESLMEKQRVLMDEAEGDEFGEASGFGLDPAQQAHLAYPVRGSLSVAVHESGGGPNAAAVSSADDFDPLRGSEFVGG